MNPTSNLLPVNNNTEPANNNLTARNTTPNNFWATTKKCGNMVFNREVAISGFIGCILGGLVVYTHCTSKCWF